MLGNQRMTRGLQQSLSEVRMVQTTSIFRGSQYMKKKWQNAQMGFNSGAAFLTRNKKYNCTIHEIGLGFWFVDGILYSIEPEVGHRFKDGSCQDTPATVYLSLLSVHIRRVSMRPGPDALQAGTSAGPGAGRWSRAAVLQVQDLLPGSSSCLQGQSGRAGLRQELP